MGRIVVAVAAGYAAIGVLVVITDQVFSAFIPGFKQMALPPLYYFSASLVTDSFYSAMGGFLCALIARAQSRKATLALIVFGDGWHCVADSILAYRSALVWNCVGGSLSAGGVDRLAPS